MAGCEYALGTATDVAAHRASADVLCLPFGVLLNVNLVSKGPENAFDYNDDGHVENSEDPTVPFQAAMGLFGMVHVAASITLCVIFVQLLRLAQRRGQAVCRRSRGMPRRSAARSLLAASRVRPRLLGCASTLSGLGTFRIAS